MKKESKRRRFGRKITAGDIMALMLLFLILYGFPRLIMGLLAPEEPGAYSMYGRPILPMTSISGAEKLEAARTVTLDFATYEEEKEYEYAPEFVRVTDSYTLTNPTDQTVRAELAWEDRTEQGRSARRDEGCERPQAPADPRAVA